MIVNFFDFFFRFPRHKSYGIQTSGGGGVIFVDIWKKGILTWFLNDWCLAPNIGDRIRSHTANEEWAFGSFGREGGLMDYDGVINSHFLTICTLTTRCFELWPNPPGVLLYSWVQQNARSATCISNCISDAIFKGTISTHNSKPPGS